MQDYKNIFAWQRAHELTLMVYQYTQAFPAAERYGMQSQMRRAAYSVPSNIAEGSSRKSDNDFRRFLEIALGSLKELQYFVLLATDLTYLTPNAQATLDAAIGQVFAPLSGFIKRLDAPASSHQPQALSLSHV